MVFVRKPGGRGVLRPRFPSLAPREGVGGWTPASLFANGAIGLWIDFSDRATLFQDTAGTTAVTADSDAIALVRDKSGGARHYERATSGKRPLFKTGILNGRPVARFDGTDDAMTGVAATLDLARDRAKLHFFAVVKYGQTAGLEETLLSFSTNANSTNGRVYLTSPQSSKPGVAGRVADADTPLTVRTGRAYDGDYIIQEALVDFAGGPISTFVNGDIEAFNRFASPANSANTNSNASWLGGRGEGLNELLGDIAEIIVVAGDVSEGDRAELYEYLNTKWGISYNGPQVYDPDGALPAAWTWWNDPRVLALSDDRYIVGGVDRGGNFVVSDIDGDTAVHTVLFANLEVDDHGNPGFLRRESDNKIMAFYSTHNAPAAYRLNISTNADSGQAWGAAINLHSQYAQNTYSYANPVQLASGRIYNFYRAGDEGLGLRSLYESHSDADDGTGWTAGVHMLTGANYPYMKVAQNGDNRIDFLIVDISPSITGNTNLYHFYLLDTGGTITYHKSDGTQIVAAMPFDMATELTLVFDGSTGALPSVWHWDLVIDADGLPVGIAETYVNRLTDHRIHQVRWNGSEWLKSEVCASGGYIDSLVNSSGYYGGGAVTDPWDVNVIYACRQVDGNGNIDAADGIFQVFKFVSWDDGQTWDAGTQLTFETEHHAFRPYIADGGNKVFYNYGRYAGYTDYAVEIRSLSLDRPEKITNGDFATGDLTGFVDNDTGTGSSTYSSGMNLVGTNGSNQGRRTQQLSLDAGAKYRVEWEGSTASGNASIGLSSTVGTTLEIGGKVIGSGGHLEFIAPPGTVHLMAITATGGGDATLTRITCRKVAADPAEMVATNPHFSTSVTGWVAGGSATVAWDSDGGNGAALVNVTGAAGRMDDSQIFALTVGRTYRFTARVKAGTYAGQLALQVAGATLTTFTPTGSYVDYDGTFVAASADPTVAIARNTANTGTFYVDRVSIKDVTP